MKVINKEKREDTYVWTIQIGYSEMEVLHDLLWEWYRKLPKKLHEILPLKHRLGDMVHKLGVEIAIFRKEKPDYKKTEYITHEVQKNNN